ncbi:uncharacterized protein LOC128683371 isoform X2 [Plodia interpunctella]|uniref:uncharacterized protein LOC128683371 isoform X2 n=1 Tax=Plodia interpunctella TaxID=58824 RepID=UPI0031019952
MFNEISSIVMAAASKKGSKSKGKGGKASKSPSTQSIPCDFCPPSVCQEGPCAGSDASLGYSVCPKIKESYESIGSACTGKKGKAKPKAKGGKGGGKGGKGKKGKDSSSKESSASDMTADGSESMSPKGMCTVTVYKWTVCEILMAAIVFALVVFLISQACKIMSSSRRRRRRNYC